MRPSDTSLVARLEANLAALRRRIEEARARSPRAAPEVTLLPVTKTAPTSLFGALRAAGVTEVGENRLPAAAERRGEGPGDWRWHGIGHLQRNKVRLAVRTFDVFHALDSLRLAEALEHELAREDRTLETYVQVNAAEDPAKGGFDVAKVRAALEALTGLPHLRVVGFMTMAALDTSERDERQTFCTLRSLRDEAVRWGVGQVPPSGLSMGMSNDFELAVEEGSTLVRIGRAVFADVLMGEASSDAVAPSEEESR